MKRIPLFLSLFWIHISFAAITVPIYLTTANGTSEQIGSIKIEDSKYGALIMPNLAKLKPGIHGLHIHEHPSCTHDGMTAGSHYDPKNTGKHLGPYQNGHLGDLPVLIVDSEGNATLTILAPRVKSVTFKGRAIMIHEGGDNYSDNPPLGGGGKRVACGIVK